MYILLLFTSIIFSLFIINIFNKNKYYSKKEINDNSYHTKGGLSYKNWNCYFGKEKRKINYKKIDYYRDLPCGNNYLRAYWLIYNYQLGKCDEDLIGSLFLKWIKDGNIKFEKKETGSIIHFINKPKECAEIEEKIYTQMFEASFGNKYTGYEVDNILSVEEFKIWYKNNYSKVSEWFNQLLDYEVDCLIEEGKIKIEKKKNGTSYKLKYIVDDSMREEALKLAGLKHFLTDFTIINNRETMEIMLFDSYLIYASLFGIADKVYDTVSDLYPKSYDFNYDDESIMVEKKDMTLINYIFKE